MSNPELAKDSSSPELPGLSIYRPVLNISEALETAIINRMNNAGLRTRIKNREIRLQLSPMSTAEVIGPREILWFQKRLGIVATKETNDQLADYLGERMPESFDDRLRVNTKPIKEYRHQRKVNRTIFTIATDNPVIREERRITQELITDFYGGEEKVGFSDEERWRDYGYRTAIRVAHVKTVKGGTGSVDLFRRFLEHEVERMPGELLLGPVTIDDV